MDKLSGIDTGRTLDVEPDWQVTVFVDGDLAHRCDVALQVDLCKRRTTTMSAPQDELTRASSPLALRQGQGQGQGGGSGYAPHTPRGSRQNHSTGTGAHVRLHQDCRRELLGRAEHRHGRCEGQLDLLDFDGRLLSLVGQAVPGGCRACRRSSICA